MVPFVLYFVFSFIGFGFAGEPVLHSCCVYNATTGYQYLGFPDCEEPHPNRSFSLWPEHGTITYNPISCSDHFEWSRTEFQIDAEGILHIRNPNDGCFNGRVPDGLQETQQYCLDFDLANDVSIVHACVEIPNVHPIRLEQKISSTISAVLLFITAVIYYVKPSPKWSNSAYVINQSAALSLAFVTLSGMQLCPELRDCFECLLAGYCLQYFFLASFFWMNAHCVHLYLRISQIRPQLGSLAHDNMRRTKFIRALAYSWGVPFFICLTSLLLQAFDVIPDPQFRPDVGNFSCFLHGWRVIWIYFYGPMSMIVVVNAVLFSLTFYSLIRHQVLTQNLREANRNRNQRDIWYCVQYLKLFVVTGLSWAGEMIGFVHKNHLRPDESLEYLWRATDLFNCLQGVFMFMIFVYDKNILRNLKRSRVMKSCTFRAGRVRAGVNFSMTASTYDSPVSVRKPKPAVGFDKDENKEKNLPK